MALFAEGKLFKVAGTGSGGGDQHNLGWFATQAALEEAYPTAEGGDWAIVGATDTVWIWDTDSQEWVDSDQKGQVTSVNGQTGDVVLDLLPTQTGNEGKFLTTDGTGASWSDTTNSFTISGRSGVAEFGSLFFKVNDMGYTPAIYFVNNNGTRSGLITGISTTPKGLGIGVGSSYKRFDITEGGIRMNWVPSANQEVTLGYSDARWTNVYTKKLNNGADIAIPTTGGTMAVIGVNTTATLAAADWSSNTQTVSVTGMTADGVVFVNPIPANQSAYTDAGILCTAQAAGSLTFTCDTVPSADITVTVVML